MRIMALYSSSVCHRVPEREHASQWGYDELAETYDDDDCQHA